MSGPKRSANAFRDTRMRAAGLVLAVAMTLLGVAAVGALRVGAVGAAAPPPLVPDSALRIGPPGAGIDIGAAVAQDLFTDDRRAPANRYLVPGETDLSVEPVPRPVVLGTAIGSDGQHFAIALLPGGVSTIVREGGRIGGYTVVSIVRGKASFRGSDGERFTLDASKP